MNSVKIDISIGGEVDGSWLMKLLSLFGEKNCVLNVTSSDNKLHIAFDGSLENSCFRR